MSAKGASLETVETPLYACSFKLSEEAKFRCTGLVRFLRNESVKNWLRSFGASGVYFLHEKEGYNIICRGLVSVHRARLQNAFKVVWRL